MRVQELEPDLLVVIGDAYESNAAVFLNGDEALLVDAMGSRADAVDLKDFIETKLKKQVRFIICTHYFSDHLAALKLFPEAHVVAHRNYLDTFNTERFRSAEEEAHFVEPDILISDEMLIRWGRHSLDIFHNPGHTASTLGIDVAASDLLIVGDTVVGNIVYLAYSTPELLFSALERLKRRNRSRLLSSHTGVRSHEAIDHACSYLANLHDRSRAAWLCPDPCAALAGIELESCLADGVRASDYEKIFHGRNLESIAERKYFMTAA